MGDQKISELLHQYFELGIAEGREGRNHDTEDGDAQRVLSEIEAEITTIRQLLSEADKREREARNTALEEAAILADHHAGMARKEADELRNVKDYTRAAQLVSEVDALLALSHCLRALQSEER